MLQIVKLEKRLLCNTILCFMFRNVPCSSGRVFDFAWTLFVCVKADFPDISDDLVNSYHLLLACCDLIFSNALLSDRRDMLNSKFQGEYCKLCGWYNK